MLRLVANCPISQRDPEVFFWLLRTSSSLCTWSHSFLNWCPSFGRYFLVVRVLYSVPFVVVVIKVLVLCSLLWLLTTVTLKVCTGIVSISRRGSEEEIIFPRREGTYLTGRCSSSNSIGD